MINRAWKACAVSVTVAGVFAFAMHPAVGQVRDGAAPAAARDPGVVAAQVAGAVDPSGGPVAAAIVPTVENALAAVRAGGLLQRRVPSDGTPVQTGYAATIVHRPATQVVAILHDVGHYRDFLPRFVQSQELRRGTGSQDMFVRFALNPLIQLWARIRYRDTAAPDGGVVIAGQALQGNVDRMDVRWRVTPVDNGSSALLEFWTLVLPSIPIPLPAAILSREQETAARVAVEAVRQRAESSSGAAGVAPVAAAVRTL